MNTTDQTFIRAYGSDFVPNNADEAARAADYPALANSNVHAVFGSLPRQHYRVDGPSATPTAAAPQVQGGSLPAPLPARPYTPQLASTQSPSPAPQGSHPPHRQAQMMPQDPIQQAAVPPMPTAAEAARDTDAIGQHGEHLIERADDVHLPHDDLNVALPPQPAPLATPARVPRPHINFAAVKNSEPQPAGVEANVEPPIDLPNAPAPAIAPDLLNAEDGLSVLADSSVLIGSSPFEWPSVEPSIADAPTVRTEVPPAKAPTVPQPTTTESAHEVSQPAASVAEAPPEPIASVEAATDTEVNVNAPIVTPGIEVEEPRLAETPLSPAVANIDKEAAGAAMEAKADEPVATRQKLKPAWEVDRLLWPADADQLYESESEYFRHAGEKLRDASQEGLRVLGVSSTFAGEGCTTLAICLARAAAAAGAKVALLDANLLSPQLGTALGLDFARSWHETLNGKTPLAEAAVTAIADNVTLIPLSRTALQQGLRLDSDAVNDVLSQASETFDLVLVDVGSPCEQGRNCFQAGDTCPLDAAIIVRDVRATSEEETLESVSRFRALGIDAVGIAENFAASAVARAAA